MALKKDDIPMIETFRFYGMIDYSEILIAFQHKVSSLLVGKNWFYLNLKYPPSTHSYDMQMKTGNIYDILT